MIQTFVMLLVAHVAADFLLQTGAMVRRKREPLMLLVHLAVHLAVTVALLGAWHPALLALIAAHGAIDAAKTYGRLDGLAWYLGDQAAHVVTLAAAAFLLPGLWGTGLWVALLPPELAGLVPTAALQVAGLVVATRAGGFAVGLLLAPFLAAAPQLTQGSLPRAGQIIGQLERGTAYLLTILGQPAAVAFLVAAKSVLRFSSTRDDRRISEYIIVGTLASIGWALLTAMLVQALVAGL